MELFLAATRALFHAGPIEGMPGTLDATHKVPRNPSLPREEH